MLCSLKLGLDMTKYNRPQTAYAVKHCSVLLLFSRAKKKSYYFNASLTVLYQPGICVSETLTADCICRTFARMRNGHGSQGITRYSTRPSLDPSVHAFKFSLLLCWEPGFAGEDQASPLLHDR